MTPAQRTQHIRLRRARDEAQRHLDQYGHVLTHALPNVFKEPNAALQSIVRHTIRAGADAAADLIAQQPEQIGIMHEGVVSDPHQLIAIATGDFARAALALNQAEQNLHAFEEEHIPRHHLMPEPPSEEPDMEPEQ